MIIAHPNAVGKGRKVSPLYTRPSRVKCFRMLWRRALFLVSGLAAFGFGFAQTPVSVYTYYASDLQISPGVIEVSPGYTTVLELYAPVTDQFVGNAALLDIKTGSNLMVIFPKDRSGETDLVLRVKGATLLFRVRVVEKDGRPRRYVILEERPASAAAIAGAVRSGSSVGAFRGDVVRVTAVGSLRGASQAEVRVSVQNLSTSDLILDPSRIVVRQGARYLDFLAYRKIVTDRVPALETQELQIIAQDVRGGKPRGPHPLLPGGQGGAEGPQTGLRPRRHAQGPKRD